MTDFADYQVPQAHALAIFTQRVPLASNSSPVAGSPFTGTLTAGQTLPLSPIAVTQPGYEIGLSVQGNASSVTPFLEVFVQWVDSASGYVVDQQRWTVAAANAGFQVYFGTGPTAGDTLNITLVNVDSSFTMSYKLAVTQNSRLYVRHDWRQQTTLGVPNFTNGNYNFPGSILLEGTPSVAASGTQNRIIGLYAGRVRVFVNTSVAYTIFVLAFDPTVGAGVGGAEIYSNSISAAGGGNTNADVDLPRCPCVLELLNNGGSSATFNVAVVIDEQLA